MSRDLESSESYFISNRRPSSLRISGITSPQASYVHPAMYNRFEHDVNAMSTSPTKNLNDQERTLIQSIGFHSSGSNLGKYVFEQERFIKDHDGVRPSGVSFRGLWVDK
jgi:hypothetical protein